MRIEIAHGSQAKEAESSGIPVDENFMAEMLGIHLRRVAKEKGVSKKQIAEKLEVHPSNITRIFQHPEKSSMQTLLKIARAMDVPMADLLRGPTTNGD